MSLFENFPYTNLHELNLDWLIQEMENLKELVQDGPVISVNGQTGVVTLYQEAQVRLPDVTDAQQTYWNIFRSLNGHLYGIRFDSNGNVYAIRDGIRTKLLTWADIPPESGVISVNGLYGVVHISGTDIPWMGGENETVFDKLSENEDAIDLLNITLGTLTNAIKSGIAYLEPNVDDTAIHNIQAGRYVFWKNYAYKTTQAISIGDTLSSTNLQAVGDGGFINALQAELQTQINTINTTLTGVKETVPSDMLQAGTGVTLTLIETIKIANLLLVSVTLSVANDIPHNGRIFAMMGYGHPKFNNCPISLISDSSNKISHVKPVQAGIASIEFESNGITAAGSNYVGTIIVPLN